MIAVAAAIIYFCLQVVDVLQEKCRGSEALNSPLFITAISNRLVSLGPLQIILLDIKPDVVMICGRVKLESLGRQAGDSSPLSATQRSGAGERANAEDEISAFQSTFVLTEDPFMNEAHCDQGP
jgi:hypothetical protein